MVKPDTDTQSHIEAHGIIGDMRTAALVNDKGSVDFSAGRSSTVRPSSARCSTALRQASFSWRRTCPTPGVNRSTCRTPMSC